MLSEALKEKFDRVIARYPVKRSAIVPLLMFAQDEIGYVSDEAIEEIARRVGVRPIEVIEDIGLTEDPSRAAMRAITKLRDGVK